MDRLERLEAARRRLADAEHLAARVRLRAREINEQLWDVRWGLFEARRELAEAEHELEEALREALGEHGDPGYERNGRPVR